MRYLTIFAAAIMVGIGSLALAGQRDPIVDIGEGAEIIGPVTVKAADGRVVLDVPKGSYVVVTNGSVGKTNAR